MARSFIQEPNTAPAAPQSCFHGSCGNSLPGALLDQRLEAVDEFLLVGGGELRVFDVRVILLVLEAVDDHFKRLVILVLALLDAHDDVAVHLDEAAVAIPGEALVLAWP